MTGLASAFKPFLKFGESPLPLYPRTSSKIERWKDMLFESVKTLRVADTRMHLARQQQLMEISVPVIRKILSAFSLKNSLGIWIE